MHYQLPGQKISLHITAEGFPPTDLKRIEGYLNKRFRRISEQPRTTTREISLIYVLSDDARARVKLRTRNNDLNAPLVIVSEQRSLAAYAWEIQAHNFILGPLLDDRMPSLANALLAIGNDVPVVSRYAFSQGGEQIVFTSNQVALVKGQGEKSMILLTNGMSVTVSRRLRDIVGRLSRVPHLRQIGRSLFINLDTVTTLQRQRASGTVKLKFRGGKQSYLVSESAGKQLLRDFIAAV